MPAMLCIITIVIKNCMYYIPKQQNVQMTIQYQHNLIHAVDSLKFCNIPKPNELHKFYGTKGEWKRNKASFYD